MRFGAPKPLASSRRARRLLDFSSNGWLSVVPTKCVLGVVFTLPVVLQKLELFSPPNMVAFTFVTLAPLPEKLLAVTVPERLALAGSEAFRIVPLIWPAGSG